jgi:hypothetical protein
VKTIGSGDTIRLIYNTVIFSIVILSFLSCQKLDIIRIVKVKTGDFHDLTAISVTLSGDILDAGEGEIRQYGHCWSTLHNPTLFDPHSVFGEARDCGPIITYVSGLTGKRTYYYRTYCVMNTDTLFGEERSFSTPYDAIFYQLPIGVAPKIDGEPDDIWKSIEMQYIERNFYGESPTLSYAFWQGAWNDTALFIRVSVGDDIHCDEWCALAPGDSWNADKPEVYLDINSTLKDGLGAEDSTGHFQFAPGWVRNTNAFYNNGIDWNGGYLYYGYKLADPDYVYEYAILWSSMKDRNENTFFPADERVFGFDVTVIDRDSWCDFRNFKVWRNTGGPEGDAVTGDWYNMDDAGVVKISSQRIN